MRSKKHFQNLAKIFTFFKICQKYDDGAAVSGFDDATDTVS